MQRLLIFGAGSLAKIISQWLWESDKYSVAGFVVDDGYECDKCIVGDAIPVISYSEAKRQYSAAEIRFVIAVGYKSLRNRARVAKRITNDGYSLESIISKSASIDTSVKLGEGCIVFPNVTIEPFCDIGANNIFWSGTIICHDVKIGEHNFFAAGSLIGGEVSIENLCFFGFRSIVIHRLTLASETLIGAASMLSSDSESAAKYIGTPAKLIGFHHEYGIQV